MTTSPFPYAYAHLYTHAYHCSSLTLTRHAYLPQYIHTYGHLPYGCNDGTKYITQFQTTTTTTTTSSARWHSSSYAFIALFHFPLCQAGGIATLDGRTFISYNYTPQEPAGLLHYSVLDNLTHSRLHALQHPTSGAIPLFGLLGRF